MSTKIHDEYPVTLKFIQLSNSERATLNRAFQISSRIKSSLIDMLIEAHTKIQDRENQMWDDFAQRFGYKGIDEILDENKNIEVSWATSQIILRAKE